MNAIEKVVKQFPQTEIWWDSSPLIMDKWLEETKKEIDIKGLKTDKRSLDRLYFKEAPAQSLFTGVTTNPPLSLDVVKGDYDYWKREVRKYRSIDLSGDTRKAFWEIYKDIVLRGAKALMPIFEVSGFKRGYISGQVDPRYPTDSREMAKEGIMLNQLSPNIMVKMPGTKEGIDGIEILTSLGIPTNATLTFTLAQLVAVAEAVKRGLAAARRNGVDLSRWRSVVTLMLGRMEESKEFTKQVADLHMEITEEEKRWFGIAVFKKAYRLFRERNYESLLLAASMRLGPAVDGKIKIWHVEKLIGSEAVLTIFPNIITAYLLNYEGEEIRSLIDEPVPEQVVEKLSKIPYFRQCYNEDGIKPEEFINHAAVIETGTAFKKSADELEDFCKL
jgi:transaldolase